MPTWAWIPIGIAIAVAIAVVVLLLLRQRRTGNLRRRFGPEYDRTIEHGDGRRETETNLRSREKEREQLQIKPLPEVARVRYLEEWREIQERFVDQPVSAVSTADGLLARVMEARGYPVTDFDEQADLVSVDHPDVVQNYRAAHGIHLRNQTERVTTERLREALLHYRSLFDELLEGAHDGEVEAAADTGDAAAAPAAGDSSAPVRDPQGSEKAPPARTAGPRHRAKR